jgi:alpha-galactosidase
MSDEQLQLVTDAVTVYKSIRADLPDAVPFWPLGLPGWADSWLALGMRGPTATYLLAWHRGRLDTPRPGLARAAAAGAAAADPDALAVPVSHLRGTRLVPEVLYPRAGRGAATWAATSGELTVSLPAVPAACLVRLAR